MSDPAIKAALDVARHEVLRDVANRRGEVIEGGTLEKRMNLWRCGVAWQDSLDPVPAAIAAFLRDRARHHRRTLGMQVYADLLEDEAAAVERAAKGGDDATR